MMRAAKRGRRSAPCDLLIHAPNIRSEREAKSVYGQVKCPSIIVHSLQRLGGGAGGLVEEVP